MFDTETNTARLSAIIRWRTFSDKHIEEAKQRLKLIGKKGKYRFKKDIAVSNLLDYLGTGVINWKKRSVRNEPLARHQY